MACETTAIVLNWNGIASTRRAIASLQSNAPSLAIVVVDNGSQENEAAQLRAEFPAARVIALERNVGFARGVNAGAIAALRSGARYLLLFNNDAWIAPGSDTIARLTSVLESHATIGAVGPTIRELDGRLQSAGYDYSLWFPVPRARRAGDVLRLRRGTFLSGSCLLVRASLYARLGGLDPDYFMYGDDVDLTIRMRQAGFGTALIEDRTIRHERAASVGIASARYIYCVLRSNLIVVRKHAAAYQYPSAFAAILMASVALCFVGFRSGHAGGPRAALRAWIDFAAQRWGGYDGVPLIPARRPTLLDHAAPA
jgi:GT2 family glycosyltransferase